MSIDSDFDKLLAGGQDDPSRTRDQQIAALLTHARHTSKHLQELTGAVQAQQTTLDTMTGLLQRQQLELQANTEITSDVRAALAAGKVAAAVIKWGGAIAAGLAAIWGAWITVRGGPPAGGGHP